MAEEKAFNRELNGTRTNASKWSSKSTKFFAPF
jgi:hypothetical protein